MKRLFLLTLGALALAGSTQAETVLQQMGAAMELQAQVAARREAREEAQAALEQTEAQAEAAAARKAHEDAVLRAGLEHQALRSKLWHAEHPLVSGDPLVLWNTFDNAATIRIYLHDSGYIDLSDAQILKVQAYMKANGIKHISELGQ